MHSTLAQQLSKLLHEPEIVLAGAQTGYRNRSYRFQNKAGKDLNLIIYKQEAGIKDRIHRANLISDYLAENGLPTRRTQFSKQGGIILISLPVAERYACVYNYLPGETIPWEAYTQKHIKLLGKTLSDIHAALQSFPLEKLPKNFPQATSEMQELLSQMEQYFSGKGVVKAMQAKLGIRLDKNFWHRQHSLQASVNNEHEKSSVLHLDFVRSNVLFSTGKELKITGILDFEKTAYGPRVIDIARTLAFLIVDCKYKTEEKVRKYFLHSGYRKRGEGELPNLDCLNELLDYFWFHDFYKFLRHNPYEALVENEHYVRTVVKLLERKVLLTV